MSTNRKLTLQQKLFCKYYSTDREYFGNGLQAYAKAYNIDLSKKGKVSNAKSGASRLLTNGYILEYIRKQLELGGLSDESVDKELLFLIRQDANYNVKLGAIKEYNSLKKRIVIKTETEIENKEKVNLTDFVRELKNKSDEELLREA